MTDDERWQADKDLCGWELPASAHRLLRLPVIRWFRATWAAIQVDRHYANGGALTRGPRTGYDEWVVYAIARGWC